MTQSISDVLETYELEEKSDDVIDVIHEASECGISKKRATPAILVHTIHINTYKTWAEICNELGVSSNKLLQKRKELISSGIIEDDIQKPSTLVQGRPGRLLKLAENSNSDDIFDGTSPNSWAAGATYLDEWVHMRETPKVEVADQYNCKASTITDVSERLASFEVFSRAYATEDIGGSLGRVLARRRHSIESLRTSLSDTSNGVQERLLDLERKSDWEVNEQEYGEITFYWTTE